MTTYRYAMQQRPSLLMLADITIADPSPALVQTNHFAMVMIQSACVNYMAQDVWNRGVGTDAPGLTGFILFESIDGITISGNPKTPVMMGYTMSVDHAVAIVAMLNANIKTSLPTPTPAPPKGKGKKK